MQNQQLLLTTDAETLTPENARLTPLSTYYSNPKKTGENMTLGIPISSWSSLPSLGDEIGVFSSDGILVGSQVFNGKAIAISIWGDDFSTFEKDGILSGENFYLKLWDHNLNKEKFLKIEKWTEGSEFYYPNSINIISKLLVNSDNVNKQEIIQTFDLMGRPISNIKENQIIFILFDNGSVSKKIKY